MTSTILLFDDDDTMREQMSQALSAPREFIVRTFDASAPIDREATYEIEIERRLTQSKQDIGLIVCDKELGKYTNYVGLSANVISNVARDLGIPFCQYSRKPNYSAREVKIFEALAKWNAEEITLGGSEAVEFSIQACELARGFEHIRLNLGDSIDEKPAAALSRLMGDSDAATQVALYASGDQSLMTEIFGYQALEDLQLRKPRIFGNWLYLSLLRFPGLLIDKTACASFLNVAQVDFERPEVRAVFERFKYRGPFAGLKEYWWREKLETFYLDQGHSDGRSLLEAVGIKCEPCLDPETGERAGYLCIISNAPVSKQNSKGGIAWFPTGADLARIRNSIYEKLNALVSI